jgi:hypothetical protein
VNRNSASEEKGGEAMSTQRRQPSGDYIFRGTNRHKGRHLAVTPQNSSMKQLVYGRIRLDSETARAAFSTGTFETGLICLSGACDVRAGGESHRVGLVTVQPGFDRGGTGLEASRE